MKKGLLLFLLSVLVLLAALGGGVAFVLWMPGRSYEGEPPDMKAEGIVLRDRLSGHVHALAQEIGERNWRAYDNLERARDYIAARLGDLGYEVRHQEFQFRGRPFYNVEAVLRGAQDPTQSIVVGAHYDSVEGSPGANDNATGVAALLELARELRGRDLPAAIRFVAFANEEPPFFNTLDGMGSVEYARRLEDPAGTVRAMVSLETIGYYSDEEGSQTYPPLVGWFYPSRANFIAFVGNVRSRKVVRSMLRTFRERAAVPSEGIAAPAVIPGLSWSDHRSFWQAGVPAVMVTDTALFRDPEYHRETDTPGRLDYERMARVVSGLAAAVASLAEGR